MTYLPDCEPPVADEYRDFCDNDGNYSTEEPTMPPSFGPTNGPAYPPPECFSAYPPPEKCIETTPLPTIPPERPNLPRTGSDAVLTLVLATIAITAGIAVLLLVTRRNNP